MKPDIHPENYRFVLFRDISCDFEFLSRSCANTEQKGEYQGTTYPMVVLDISSESHPFYTGSQKVMDTEGRVDRYYKKYGFQKDESITG